MRCLAAGVALFLTVPLYGAGPDLDRLMALSGFDEQLASVPEVFEQQFETSARSQSLPVDVVRQLKSVLRVTHAEEKLRAVARRVLPTKMSAADAEAALEWLETPLGQRITALEIAASRPEGAAETVRFGAEIWSSHSPARKSLLQSLAQSLDASRSYVNMALDHQATLLHALRSHTRSTIAAPSYRAVRREVEASRAQVEAAVLPLLRDGFAYTYRDLTDEELARYVEFAETPSARRYHAAGIAALSEALASSAHELGLRLGR